MRLKQKTWVLLSALLLTLSVLTGCEAPQAAGNVTTAPTVQTAADAGAQVPAGAPETTAAAAGETTLAEETLPENGSYNTKDEVALYLHLYGHLPDNYITKKDAQALGWSGGSLEPYAPGKSIGGSRFGNYEGLLPEKKGRQYYECDIDTAGKKSRGPKRIVWSDDGLIYYTEDHYESFELLYGEEDT